MSIQSESENQSTTILAVNFRNHLHDLRGMLRSSPRLRMLRGSQHTMKSSRVANSRRVLLILRLSLITRLQRVLGLFLATTD